MQHYYTRRLHRWHMDKGGQRLVIEEAGRELSLYYVALRIPCACGCGKHGVRETYLDLN